MNLLAPLNHGRLRMWRISPTAPALLTGKRRRHLMSLAGVLLLAVGLLPSVAHAGFCWFKHGSAENVQLPAQNISLMGSLTPGQALGTSTSVNPNPDNSQIKCVGGEVHSGVKNTIAGPPSGNDDTLFPTDVPGISYRLTHTNDYQNSLHAYPAAIIPANDTTYTLENPTSMQIVYTGSSLPSNGSTIAGSTVQGLLAHWVVDMCLDHPHNSGTRRNPNWKCDGPITPQPIEQIYTGPITFTAPTCTVSAGSINKTVLLPSVPASAFKGVGSHAGQTAFSLELTNCHSGLDVSINLGTSTPAGDTGVIASQSGAGYAQGIGVQLLYDDGTTPVGLNLPLSQAHSVGSPTGSGFTIHLFARYYQTALGVTAGKVKAVATYTLSYQ